MGFIFKLFFLSSVFVLAAKPAVAEFVALKKDDIRSCSLKLAQVKHIPHQCKIISDRDNPLEVWQDRLSFDFGKISQFEFNYLKNIYSGWSKSQTAVTYSPDRSYQLIDFVPPLIQAFNGHRFIPETTTIKNKSLPWENNRKQLYMNCWGVVYEVLRAAINPQTKPTIFMGQGSLMLEKLRQNSYQVLTFHEPEDTIPKLMIQPGDTILIMHVSSTGHEYLDHIVVALDDGIYFEKAGTGENVPIRIIDEKTLRQIWQPGVFTYEIRRLKQNAILPHPQKIFSLNAPVIKNEFPLLNKMPSSIGKNTSIMWQEEEKNIVTSSWFHLLNTLPIFIDNTGKAKLKPQLYNPLLQSTIDD